jgi:tetratricopeptide (TPR) repeat protein
MTRRKRGVAAGLLAAICVIAMPRAPAAQWLEARIDDFVLVTDANEAYTRNTLRDFAVFKQALGVLAPLTRGVPRFPTVMFALDAGNWRSFMPGPGVAGFFLPQAQANFIVFDRTPAGMSSREVVFHEYMHYVLYNGSDLPLPPWWAEGVAEVFSSIAEHDGKIDFGMTPRSRKAGFAYFDLMPTSMLLSVDRDSPEYRRHGLTPMFYPQSWLTAHYMLIGRPERGRQVQRYLREVAAGKLLDDAVETAFGITMSELDEEIRAYRNEGKIRGYRLTLSAPLRDAKEVVIRKLPEPVALSRLALAGLATANDVPGAEKRALRALQLDPALPLGSAALADVRYRQERDTEALELARKAAAGDPEAVVAAGRVQWLVVDRALRPKKTPREEDATVEELIDEVVSQGDEAREPTAAEGETLRAARAMLLPIAGHDDHGLEATAVIIGIDELLGDRKPEEQLATVQPAAARYPTQPELAIAETRIYLQLGRRMAAIDSANRAARYARSPAWRRWIESWVAELEAGSDASR